LYFDILTLALKGCLKTHFMYYCKLSFTQLERYVSELLEMGLLAAELQVTGVSGPGEHIIYRTTDEGKKYLEKMRELKAFLKGNKKM